MIPDKIIINSIKKYNVLVLSLIISTLAWALFLPVGRSECITMKMVYWFIDCDEYDFTHFSKAEFLITMKKAGMPYQYRVRNGGYSWEYGIQHCILHYLTSHTFSNNK